MAEPEGNQVISLEEFNALPRHAKRTLSSERKALMAIKPGTALVFKGHGSYQCKDRGCGMRNLAANVAKKRGLLCSTIHLLNGRIAVAFYANGAR